MRNQYIVKVLQIRQLTSSSFVLRFERGGLLFKAGQHIGVGLSGGIYKREYSIYSAEQDEFLEVLVREVPGGQISSQLAGCKPGDQLTIDGPSGLFRIERADLSGKPCILVATGTGISPFHSFVKTHPDIDYHIYHGIRLKSEEYERWEYSEGRYFSCITSSPEGDYHGRVTDFFRETDLPSGLVYFICGNSRMIYEMNLILIEKGVDENDILLEVYF